MANDTKTPRVKADELAPVVKPKLAPKECLRCEHPFQPKHKHNWLCDRCVQLNTSLDTPFMERP